MRLSTQTIKHIKQTFKEVLTPKERIEKKLKFLRELKDKIGEQKIDIVISKDKTAV